MGSLSAQKFAGIAGVVFVIVLLVSGFMAPQPPTADDSAAKFVAYYNDNRSILLIQFIVSVAVVIPALPFLGGLWHRLRETEGEGGVLAPAAILGFVLVGAMALVFGALYGALGYLAKGHGLDESAAKSFGVFGAFLNIALSALAATFCLSSGYLFATKGTMPNWLGWIGIAAGALQAIAMFSIASSGIFAPLGPVGLISFLGFVVYTLAISVFMFRTPAATAAA